MKKIILITICLLVLAIPIASAQGTNAIQGTGANVSLLKYEPIPAHPGDAVDMWIQLGNAGGSVLNSLKLEFLDNYPFRLENTERRIHNIGILSSGRDYVAKFKVRIDTDAPVGNAFVKVRYSFGDKYKEERWTEALLPIDIESRITSLGIESIETIPATLKPGEDGQIKVKVKNLADSTMRRVTVKLNLDKSSAPIVPTTSATELKIEELSAGESHEFVFNVITELDAVANAYTVPINASFTEDTGDEIEYDDIIGVVISSEPELVLTVDSTDLYSDDPTGKITLQFVNKGVDEIKFVWVELQDHESYDLLSPTSSFYVGNIDSDDYEVEDITVKSNGNIVEIPMALEYRDSANKLYKTTELVKVNLVKKEQIEGKQGGIGKSLPWLIILGIVIFYFWRKRRNKKK